MPEITAEQMRQFAASFPKDHPCWLHFARYEWRGTAGALGVLADFKTGWIYIRTADGRHLNLDRGMLEYEQTDENMEAFAKRKLAEKWGSLSARRVK